MDAGKRERHHRIKGVGDFFGKAVRGKASGESTIKPEYTGNGILVLEPTYRHLILLDVADWGGSVSWTTAFSWPVSPA